VDQQRNLRVGYSGTGTLTISGGGSVSDTDGYIASQGSSHGTVTVTGTGSAWNNSGNLYVGGVRPQPAELANSTFKTVVRYSSGRH